jgi:outer membrane immunogenic protein
MMKRWMMGAAAAALTVATAVAAQAADLPTKKAAPAPVFVPPPFTWTGFYIGVNAGGVWGTGSRTATLYDYGFPLLSSSFPGSVGSNSSGFIGGGQVGYNWQSGAAVFGIESDIDWTSGSKNSARSLPIGGLYGLPATDYANLNASAKMTWLGTTRARIGFVATPDNRLMFYGTGGVAYGGGSGYLNYYDTAGDFYLHGAPSSSRVGWTVGAGVEYAITNNITLKGEYLYYNLGSSKFVTAPATFFGPGVYVAGKFNYEGSIVRAGLNYKF